MSGRLPREERTASARQALERLGAMLIRPRRLLAALGEEETAERAAVRALGYEVGVAAAILGGLSRAAASTGGRSLPGGAYPATLFVFWVALSLAVWLGFTALLHLTATLLGGRGRASELLAGVGLSYVPDLLAPLPVALAHLGLGAAAWLLGSALTLWHLLLVVLAVSAVHRLRAEAAVGALVLPPAALAALGLIGLLPLVTGILHLLG